MECILSSTLSLSNWRLEVLRLDEKPQKIKIKKLLCLFVLFYFYVLTNVFNSKSISTHLNEVEQSRNHCSCGEAKLVHFQMTFSLS